MPKKDIYDNMFRVIKVNSGQLDSGGGKLTEILDLQIPRGYVARIRDVIFYVRYEDGQVPALDGIAERTDGFFMALVNDPDDEVSTAIPTHEIDHDVVADFECYVGKVLSGTAGGYSFTNPRSHIHFGEDVDVIAPRNMRFNASGNIIGAVTKPQCLVEVYFTYEKVSSEAIMELLNIA